MDTFAESAYCHEYIADISETGLDRNLAHDEIRIGRPGSSDAFIRYSWDGRVFLDNAGGAHHFAAARYIARRIGRRVPFTGRLIEYRLHASAVARLQARFALFLIDSDYVIYDVLRTFGPTMFWLELPAGITGGQVLVLERTSRRSLRLATLLHERGFMDFGAYLSGLACQ